MNLRKYLTLAVIIGPLPVTIVDGQIADANPVMANFNWIVSQVNANAVAGSGAGSLVVAQKNSGVQTFTSSPSKVAFNTAAIDLNTEFNIATFRFTAKNTGIFSVGVSMILDNASQQYVSLAIYVNGVPPISSGLYTVTASPPTIFSASYAIPQSMISLNALDYIEVWCSVNTGSVTTDASGGNRFNILQVR
jgi:hypothetical protein